MNQPNRQDYEQKLLRLRAFLRERSFDAVLLSRKESTAWLTGGDMTVLRNSDRGVGTLMITAEDAALIARSMDADRIMDEELTGLGIRQITISWRCADPAVYAASLLPGKRIANDEGLPGCEECLAELRTLRLPYTALDLERWNALGRCFDAGMLRAAEQLRPGMTELEAAAILSGELERAGVLPLVILVGSDERIAKYRHPLPSAKQIKSCLMLHAAGTRNGQCAAVSRMLCFGPVPEQLRVDYEYLNQMQAMAFSRLRPGERHGSILEDRMRFLQHLGRADEYEKHFPGADIGYALGSAAPFLENTPVQDTECYDIFLTLTGAKVEELVMAGPQGGSALSSGSWPTKRYTAGEYSCELPVILEK